VTKPIWFGLKFLGQLEQPAAATGRGYGRSENHAGIQEDFKPFWSHFLRAPGEEYQASIQGFCQNPGAG
jgi:hypothetical protein